MKNKLTFAFGLLSIVFVNAQIYTPNAAIQGNSGNGYLGIGRAPSYRLEISGSHQDSQILLHSLGGNEETRQADLMLWASEPEISYSGVGIGNNVKVTQGRGLHLLNSVRGGSYLRLLDNSMSFNIISSVGVNRQALSINEKGNIGVGVGSANTKLEVAGSDLNIFEAAGFYNTVEYDNVNSRAETRINIGKIEYTTRQPMGAIGAFPAFNSDSANGNLALYTRENQSVVERMRIKSNGNVGIGITDPQNKLDVNGTIHSKEVKVDMTGWSDFVFKKEYNLPTLEQVQKHIAEKGHLENIPSEAEVLKNGINLGEMNSKLLQKIEELTLYVIEQDKKTEQLKTFISEQNKIISEQHKRIEKLEKK
ncbi:hypothetical protein [uncultured Flavobacterium sp.]|uniref:hypothetical protein n=1 Tax=uncultured Flavobacterium sp. TaxID=165435 RepID=UPI0025D19727|nr:hypothetical protein [uncultured Flavobacterium sp.]